MTEAIFKYRASRVGECGLFPVDEEGVEILTKLKLGRDVGCDVKKRRNPKHHRLFFQMIQFLQTHSPIFEHMPTEKAKYAIKLATGCGQFFVDTETGQSIFVPRSISFASMEQGEFEHFFDDFCKVAAHRWMPAGTTAESVRAELLKMIDWPGALGSKVA